MPSRPGRATTRARRSPSSSPATIRRSLQRAAGRRSHRTARSPTRPRPTPRASRPSASAQSTTAVPRTAGPTRARCRRSRSPWRPSTTCPPSPREPIRRCSRMPPRRRSAPGRPAITPGPASEAGQTVGFAVASSDPALFALGGQPAVTAAGTLTFTPAPGTHGVATITVRAVDDGGTAGGGSRHERPAGLHDHGRQPVARRPTPIRPACSRTTRPASRSTCSRTTPTPRAIRSSVASYDDSTIANGSLTSNGGGSFTYVPATHFAGTDTFSYTASRRQRQHRHGSRDDHRHRRARSAGGGG